MYNNQPHLGKQGQGQRKGQGQGQRQAGKLIN